MCLAIIEKKTFSVEAANIFVNRYNPDEFPKLASPFEAAVHQIVIKLSQSTTAPGTGNISD